MKVLFITQNDPIYVRLFFEELFQLAQGRVEIVEVVVAPAMGQKSLVALVRQMWNFYGPLDFLRVGMRYAALRVLAALPGPLRGGKTGSVRQVARAHGIAVCTVADVNADEFVDLVRARGVDVIASVAAPQIFRAPLLGAARFGCINIHNSVLPKYRGMLPNFWQMYHGERSVGTTVHRLNARLDDGAILAQSASPVVPGESLDQLIRRTKRGGARLMLETLEALKAGTATEGPNPASEGSYFSFPTRADVREFRRRGLRLI